MQQQLFDFVWIATTRSPVRLDPLIAAEVTRLMAAAIVAVSVDGMEGSDEGSTRVDEQQDHGPASQS